MNEMEDQGAISPAGRFARMEAALERIEAKLDSKADERTVEELSTRVLILETRSETSKAVSETLLKAADMRYRFLGYVVGFLTIINLSLGAVLAYLAFASAIAGA